MSLVVHALLSLQGLALFVCTQPLAGLHESLVQTLLSSQLTAVPPLHTPAVHASFVVHALPSSQLPLTGEKTQPLAGLQLSLVQTLLSSQASAAPPVQTPALQVSFVVHALPSLHGPLMLECTQPPEELHVSAVHGFPSSQLSPPVPWQTPFLQASPVLHAFPSSQVPVTFV